MVFLRAYVIFSTACCHIEATGQSIQSTHECTPQTSAAESARIVKGFPIVVAVLVDTGCICHTISIYAANGIIAAICEHIISKYALAGGGEGICIDKSADFGVIVAALEVIEAGFSGGTIAIQAKMALNRRALD